jgi:hypothetical protein
MSRMRVAEGIMKVTVLNLLFSLRSSRRWRYERFRASIVTIRNHKVKEAVVNFKS